jgi:hypothetical protein
MACSALTARRCCPTGQTNVPAQAGGERRDELPFAAGRPGEYLRALRLPGRAGCDRYVFRQPADASSGGTGSEAFL